MLNKYNTEEKIEAEAERMQDQLDNRYMKSAMCEEEYLMICDEIKQWVDLRYKEIRK